MQPNNRLQRPSAYLKCSASRAVQTPSYFFSDLQRISSQSGSENPNKKPEIKIPGLIRFLNQLGLIEKDVKRLQKYIFVEQYPKYI